MCEAAAEGCKVFGPSNCVLMAWMPNCSKWGSTTSPFDDEVVIMTSLTKAGFKRQDRIRMMVEPAAVSSLKVNSLDWWIDGRMCYLESDQHLSKDNFWFAIRNWPALGV